MRDDVTRCLCSATGHSCGSRVLAEGNAMNGRRTSIALRSRQCTQRKRVRRHEHERNALAACSFPFFLFLFSCFSSSPACCRWARCTTLTGCQRQRTWYPKIDPRCKIKRKKDCLKGELSVKNRRCGDAKVEAVVICQSKGVRGCEHRLRVQCGEVRVLAEREGAGLAACVRAGLD